MAARRLSISRVAGGAGSLPATGYDLTTQKGTHIMPKTETPAPAIPAFAPVKVADLPAATKQSKPENIALGAAILAVAVDGNAAQDPTTYTVKNDASKRAAVLKRAVEAALKSAGTKGLRPVSRIVSADGAFRVNIYTEPVPEPEATPVPEGDATEDKEAAATTPATAAA